MKNEPLNLHKVKPYVVFSTVHMVFNGADLSKKARMEMRRSDLFQKKVQFVRISTTYYSLLHVVNRGNEIKTRMLGN